MPKMKTKRAAAKRFRVSGGKAGVIKHGKAFRRHCLSPKSAKRKRHLAAGGVVDKTQEKQLKRLIPYLG